ncbi:hypothetical protein F9L33_02920 [Amylibacter sp. SFDW26]|uniref:YhdP family protein n=1 Tax=Amylibacter sp. SFDW26 TaxID=2652722 RepID=UPI001261DEB0|nr:DUF3971 domain-containing protein [Amylibacter sp. SFDW26]KAB7615730.1 hypothetical protein F9L33_02920 [Amylibacter sp. SFDW26]
MVGKQADIEERPRSKSAFRRVFNAAVYLVSLVIVLFVIAGAAFLIRIKSGPLAVPAAQQTVERLASDALSDFDVTVGAVNLVMASEGLTTQVQLSDVVISSKEGQRIVALPIVRATLDPITSIRSGIEVNTVEVIGAEIRVLRDRNGKFNFLPADSDNTAVIGPDVVFANINAAAVKRPLNTLKLITMADTQVTYVDQLNGQIWTSTKTLLKSERDGDVITADADIVLQSTGQEDTSAGFRFSYNVGADDFDFGLKFENAKTTVLADQVPTLNFMRSFDAAVTGSLNTTVTTDGTLGALSGVLEASEGQLLESPQAHPVKFNGIKAYFDYDKAADSFNFTEVTAESSVGKLSGGSNVSLFRDDKGVVTSVSGVMDLTKLELYPEGVFEEPVVLDSAHANVHLTLSPLTLTLQDATLKAGDQSINLYGSSVAGDVYWNNSYLITFNEATRDEVMHYWPVIAKPKTRDWIKQNVQEGIAKNGRAQISSKNGAINVDFKFDIEDAKVRYLKTLPVIQSGFGKGHLTEKTFSAFLSTGHVISPNGEKIIIDGSKFTVPNLTAKPSIGEVDLKAKSTLQGALFLLDEQPFEFLKKVNLKPNLGTGQADVVGKLLIPLEKGVTTDDVIFDANAIVTDLTSKELVKGRTIVSEQMKLHADNDGLTLTGNAKLDGLLAKTEWVMPIGKEHNGRSSIVADVTLNDANLRILGIQFNKGTVTGASPAVFKIDFEKGRGPEYSLTSTMTGLGLNLSGLNWAKPRNAKGKLAVSGKLGDKLTIDALSVEAAGLKAKGAVLLNADNTFRRADFTNVTVDRWLNITAAIEATGGGKTKITVSKGTADLRNVSFSKSGQGQSGAPMDILLDRLILADGMTLTSLRAKLQNNKGLRGNYSARVNGGAAIKGTIFPQQHGTAAEITSVNAGEVMRSADLYKKGVGGGLRMVIVPTEKEGEYKGTFQIKKFKVKQDSVLADILNAISVVGLVQQLSGDGIVFESVDGQFALKPKGVELRKTSAVGASIGMTLDGTYNTATTNLNFEGVVTPIYALNGTLERIFGKLFGRTRGEGLFSFVYNMSGPAKDPQIGVNPFSILAPGAFREVFRTDIPNIDAPQKTKPVRKKKQTDPVDVDTRN